MPIRWKSPNSIDPTLTFIAFLISVLVGARRFVHASLLRGQRFKLTHDPQFVSRLYQPLAEWRMQRLPQRGEGYTLDLDSTVFGRYGKQEGSPRGIDCLRRHCATTK